MHDPDDGNEVGDELGDALGATLGDVEGDALGAAVVGAAVGPTVLSQHIKKVVPSCTGQHSWPTPSPRAAHLGWRLQSSDDDGESVGRAVGRGDGANDGLSLGDAEGRPVGLIVGDIEGASVLSQHPKNVSPSAAGQHAVP